MTGGGALLNGLDKLLSKITHVPVNIAESSVECVAEGTGKVLEYIDKIDVTLSDGEVALID